MVSIRFKNGHQGPESKSKHFFDAPINVHLKIFRSEHPFFEVKEQQKRTEKTGWIKVKIVEIVATNVAACKLHEQQPMARANYFCFGINDLT